MGDLLYVITDLRLGGVPLHLRGLLAAALGRRMAAPGVVESGGPWRVTVATLSPGGQVADMLRADGVEVLDCGGRGGWDARVIFRLARIIQSVRPQLIHSFLFHANLAARIAGKLVGFPSERLLCEIQTVEVERQWHLTLDHATHEWCRLTIGNSPSVVEHLHRVAGIPLSRLRLIRGGVDPARFAGGATLRGAQEPGFQKALRESLALPVPVSALDAPWILWVGRLDPVKGLHLLFEAFQRVARSSSAHLMIAGDGPLRSDLERQIRGTPLGQRVHLLGPRRDVPDLLRAADLFVFPSRTEGLPNALLEAMACGLPIVTTDVPGCRDLICDQINGLVVPYDDVAALAPAMQAQLTDRASASRMAQAARSSVEQLWNIRRTYAEYWSLYDQLLPSPSKK